MVPPGKNIRRRRRRRLCKQLLLAFKPSVRTMARQQRRRHRRAMGRAPRMTRTTSRPQLALAPLLGPYPQAYTASQLRSLRRAPVRLDHRPVHIVRTAHRSSVSSLLLSHHRPHRRLECQQELLAQAPASTPTNVFPGGTTASSRRHLRLFPCQGSRRTATSRPPRACDWPRQRARRRRQLQTTAACALSRRGVAIDGGWVQQLLGLMIMRVYFQ